MSTAIKKRPLDDPDITLTAMVVIVGTLLTFVVVVFLQALFYRAEQKEYERKVVEQAPQAIRGLRADQNAILNKYRWIDQAGGIAAIPIERAMELMVERSGPEAGGEGE